MNRLMSAELVGKWPTESEEARKNKRFVKIKPEDRLYLIHGTDSHILFSMFVSNDVISCGEMVIAPQMCSDCETHEGDEVIYVVKGILTVLIVETEKKEFDLHRSYELHAGQTMLIPEGYKHKYFNFTREAMSAFFAVAPAL